MNLCKWKSNSQSLLQTIPKELREEETTQLISPPEECLKTLGIHWNTNTDCFHIATPTLTSDDRPTKWKIASDVAKKFDLLGQFSPSIIVIKLLPRRVAPLSEVDNPVFRAMWGSVTQQLLSHGNDHWNSIIEYLCLKWFYYCARLVVDFTLSFEILHLQPSYRHCWKNSCRSMETYSNYLQPCRCCIKGNWNSKTYLFSVMVARTSLVTFIRMAMQQRLERKIRFNRFIACCSSSCTSSWKSLWEIFKLYSYASGVFVYP